MVYKNNECVPAVAPTHHILNMIDHKYFLIIFTMMVSNTLMMIMVTMGK